MRMLSRLLLISLLLPSLLWAQTFDHMGSPVISTWPATGRWQCSKDNIGATLTECLAAQGGDTRAYIAWLTIQSTTATAGQFLLRTGTQTTTACDTGAASIYPSDAAVVRFTYPGNTVAPLHLTLPYGVPASAANSQLCIICTAINTCTVAMGGPLAP